MTRCGHCNKHVQLKRFLGKYQETWHAGGSIFCQESESGLHQPLPDLGSIEEVDSWLRS